MKLSHLLPAVVTSVLIAACGSSSTSDDNQAPDPDDVVLSGRFVDSAVTGLQYSTPTQSGETGTDGSFDYQQGENVTFSIGDITLPATPGADIITPLSVFSTTDITDVRVMNLARLLQTLDTDGNAENGIALSSEAYASATGLNVDFASSEFETQVVNLVANGGSSNTTLVSGIDALEHLQETLFDEGLEQRPMDISEETTLPDTTGDNTSTHPAVGATGQFSSIEHGVAGTLTVLDDRTIEISDFDYDGGGIAVFFYTGVDGNYSNGVPIGPQLNGRPYNGETLTLTLPDNLTLDDFNGLSVWCVPFATSFGDTQF